MRRAINTGPLVHPPADPERRGERERGQQHRLLSLLLVFSNTLRYTAGTQIDTACRYARRTFWAQENGRVLLNNVAHWKPGNCPFPLSSLIAISVVNGAVTRRRVGEHVGEQSCVTEVHVQGIYVQGRVGPLY